MIVLVFLISMCKNVEAGESGPVKVCINLCSVQHLFSRTGRRRCRERCRKKYEPIERTPQCNPRNCRIGCGFLGIFFKKQCNFACARLCKGKPFRVCGVTLKFSCHNDCTVKKRELVSEILMKACPNLPNKMLQRQCEEFLKKADVIRETGISLKSGTVNFIETKEQCVMKVQNVAVPSPAQICMKSCVQPGGNCSSLPPSQIGACYKRYYKCIDDCK